MSLRHKILTAVKMLGGFSLAQVLTKQGLQVLCYHGISLQDEHYFQPKLFMREDTFRERMVYLKKSGFRVLSLDEALAGINQKMLPPKTLVITFDDGWLGIGTKAAPVLKKYGFPSTLYVTTRDVINEAPVFDVTLRYLLWKKRNEVLDLGNIGLGAETIVLSSSDERERTACHISEISKDRDDNDKQALLLKLAKTLDINLNSDKDAPLFRLMTMEQLAQLPSSGMDLQLHTHCHRLPVNDPEGLESEIVKNRSILERIVHGSLQHLCYPSGKFHPSQFPLLQKLGVKSATTCLSGFNYPDTERFALCRFLDGENITQLEFEAELSGFLELMRKFRRILSGS
jgi:peptidoglycan/xylan/chitin deacetylase (PgdA/CDA1 family)